MPKAKNTAAKKSVGRKSKKTAPASKGIKKSRKATGRMKKDGTFGKKMKYKPGTVALREIKKYQKSTKL